MREILFRGKRIDNGEWVEGGIVHQTDFYGDSIDRYFIIDGTETDDVIGPAYQVDPSTISEFTGLTDKNGKKIFEGDILQIYEGSEDDGYKIREVYSYRGVLCVDYETSEWDFNALAFLDSDNVFTFEVIGNIHDNPELLEDKP